MNNSTESKNVSEHFDRTEQCQEFCYLHSPDRSYSARVHCLALCAYIKSLTFYTHRCPTFSTLFPHRLLKCDCVEEQGWSVPTRSKFQSASFDSVEIPIAAATRSIGVEIPTSHLDDQRAIQVLDLHFCCYGGREINHNEPLLPRHTHMRGGALPAFVRTSPWRARPPAPAVGMPAQGTL